MKVTTINLSLPRELLDQADREAKRESRSRSELMREALRMYLERWVRWERIFAYADSQAERLGLRPGDVAGAVREARKG